MRWFEAKRLEWIKEMLGVYGFINREHVMKKFGVSLAQAALDFQKFQELYPGYMVYNTSTKRYENGNSK